MAKHQFLTVPNELIGHAESAMSHYQFKGYSVTPEPSSVGQPYTPALKCKRGQTSIYVEVDRKIDVEKLDEWWRYAHTFEAETQVVLVVPGSARINVKSMERIKALGIGFYRCNGSELVEVLQPMDLSLQLSLPAIKTLPSPVRKLVAPVYERFESPYWREGFELACIVLEREARKYLAKQVAAGRGQFIRQNGNSYTLTEGQVNKKTLGQLGYAFKEIQRQNHTEAMVGTVLNEVNEDRVGVAHFRGDARAEKRLRKNVNKHMWSIIAALKTLSR